MRISINAGKVTAKKGDLFGRAINVAARIDKHITLPGQILIGQNLYDIIKDSSSIKTKFLREENFKGVKEKVKIYEVLW